MTLLIQPQADPYVNDRTITNALRIANQIHLDEGIWRVTQRFSVGPGQTVRGTNLVNTEVSAQTAGAGFDISTLDSSGHYGGSFGGFTFNGNGVCLNPVYVGKSNGRSIEQMIIKGSTDRALFLDSAQNLTITNPIINNNYGDGIVFDHAADGITIVGGNVGANLGYAIKSLGGTGGIGGDLAAPSAPASINVFGGVYESNNILWQPPGIVYLGCARQWKFDAVTFAMGKRSNANPGTCVALHRDFGSSSYPVFHVRFDDCNFTGHTDTNTGLAQIKGVTIGTTCSAYFSGTNVMTGGILVAVEIAHTAATYLNHGAFIGVTTVTQL